eukprot:TRINITY_DN1093_c0_g1_i1.p1 TRINITY_DN1093_c0_g1~~TRINITY_DN1093_c0_g1_i1.p1  ORF type:complete len:365 (+),score=112.18 TRINITY_DN1093_c0_g1_i1:45-1139(+)
MSDKASEKKPVRVYVDGCFDMMHFGHANALRQARELGDILVVGVHNDDEITRHKGPPVMNEQERYKAVRACKWADEVVEAAPYIADLKTLDEHNCDFCVHGEDISVGEDGRDVYEGVKNSGRFKIIKRTEGISTTELVGRMLLMTKEHLLSPTSRHNPTSKEPMARVDKEHLTKVSPYTSMSHFLPTTRKIAQFAEGRSPKEGDKIGYIDGGFDLFHVGHTEVLKQARANCDYLIVGVHDDLVVHEQRGGNFPIMNLHERVLGVLSCRHVDEVVIGAPFHVTAETLEALKLQVVFHGDDELVRGPDGEDPYELPKKKGLYMELKSTPNMSAHDIVSRIIENRLKYEQRNKKKEKKEATYISEAK